MAGAATATIAIKGTPEEKFPALQDVLADEAKPHPWVVCEGSDAGIEALARGRDPHFTSQPLAGMASFEGGATTDQDSAFHWADIGLRDDDQI